jgi:predicted house-cleaning noncanonical NTP pyrophosphatase (MazG superfamily)
MSTPERIYYNKLCRDKIPHIIAQKGFECEVREVDHAEYKREILRKVFEEASGVSNNTDHDKLVAEIADLLITLDAVKREFGITEAEVQEAVEESLTEKGSYHSRLYLSWSSDTDYRSNESAGGIDD